jgi:hypothetical protein
MGAAVEILGSAAEALKVFTDDRGFYSVASLLPGTYSVKVSAPSFLPSLREKIGVRAGAKLMVNVTLTTLFEAIQLVPLRVRWTTTTGSGRCARSPTVPFCACLRMARPWSPRAGNQPPTSDLKGSVTFLAGSPGQGYGSPSDMTAGFAVERSLLSSGVLRLNGNVGYDPTVPGVPSAVLRTTYTNRFNGFFEPSVAITALRLNSPDLNTMPGATLQALSVRPVPIASSSATGVEMKLGSELQTIQFMGRVNTFKPFASADLHITPNTVLEYQYASSVPNTGLEDRLGGNDRPGDDAGFGLGGLERNRAAYEHHQLCASR